MTTASKQTDADFFIRLQPGEFVFQEGDPGTNMYIIEDGNVELLKISAGEELQLAVLEQGDFFGEMAILEDQPRSASARAMNDCQLLKIDKSTFNEMLRQNPEIAVRMLRKLSRRLRHQSIGGPATTHEAPPMTDPGIRQTPASSARSDEQQAASALAGVEGKNHTMSQQETRRMESVEMPAGSPSQTPRVKPSPDDAKGFKFVVEESGSEISVPERSEIMVGRPDPVTGIQPDIDLTTLDTMRSVSRRHAKIFREGNAFFVCEEIGTANGTFVNHERITTGARVPISDGDHVSFGRVGTIFRQI